MKKSKSLLFFLAIAYPIILSSQNCINTRLENTDFRFKVQSPVVETGWYQEWLDYTGGARILPDSLPKQDKLVYKDFKSGFSGAMHEEGPFKGFVRLVKKTI